jgi:hypothetical protein
MGMALAAGAQGLVSAKGPGKPEQDALLDAKLGYGMTIPLPDYGGEAALGPAKTRNWRLEMLQHPMSIEAADNRQPSNERRLGVALRLTF